MGVCVCVCVVYMHFGATIVSVLGGFQVLVALPDTYCEWCVVRVCVCVFAQPAVHAYVQRSRVWGFSTCLRLCACVQI